MKKVWLGWLRFYLYLKFDLDYCSSSLTHSVCWQPTKQQCVIDKILSFPISGVNTNSYYAVAHCLFLSVGKSCSYLVKVYIISCFQWNSLRSNYSYSQHRLDLCSSNYKWVRLSFFRVVKNMGNTLLNWKGKGLIRNLKQPS